MKILLFYVFLINLSTQLLGINQSQLQFYHLEKDIELTQTSVNGLYQDEYGVLWIGTRNGIKKYDGILIESVKVPGISGEVSSGCPPSVCGDKNGHVFFNMNYQIIEHDLRKNAYRTIFKQYDTSVPSVASFCCRENELWIGLKDSVFSYCDGALSLYAVLSEPSAEISSICESVTGGLYVATKEHGLFYFLQKKEYRQAVPESEIITLFEDSKQNLWLGTLKDGLYKITPQKEILHYVHETDKLETLYSNYVRAIAEDDLGNLWIGTMQGINRLNPITGKISSYGLENENGLINSSVWAILKDRMGIMWFGTYYGGVSCCNPETNVFSYVNMGAFFGSDYPVVSKIVEDKRGDLWIGTEGHGLIRYDDISGKFSSFIQELGSVSCKNVKSFHYDANLDQLWIGTHLGGLVCYNLQTKESRHFVIDEKDHSKNSRIVHGLVATSDTLYIGTLSNVYRLCLSTGIISKIEILQDHFFEIRDLLLDDYGRVWVAGNQLCCYDPAIGSVRCFNAELKEITSADQVFTTCLLKNSAGEIIVGTSGEGFLRYVSDLDSFDVYNDRTVQMKNNSITCLGETENGVIVAGNSSGFSCVDMHALKSYNFDSSNGFPLLSMLPGCVFQDDSGKMILGGINGITFFNESSLQFVGAPMKLFFSKLLVNNQEVMPYDKTNILSDALGNTDSIVLKYDQNNLSIRIGHDNFLGLGQPRFQYKLLGFDKDWVDFSPEDWIKYMNLPYGCYQLLVRSVVCGNYNDSQEIMLSIEIFPPWYLSWYAFLFYLFLIGCIIYFFRSRLLLRTSLELERREKQQEKEMNIIKQRFFANMSHELRTPLTLIIGQLELLLMNNCRIPANIYENIEEAYSSASRMNRLISELLDFLKYDQKKYCLKIAQFDIVEFLHNIFISFSALSELKGITFTFSSEIESEKLWFDPSQMNKVFNNLLSNAFKYTDTGGNISVNIEKGEQTIRILVRDTGIGIPEHVKDKIFERFVQLPNKFNQTWKQTGTGIGLSLSWNILEAHHGSIRVESQLDKGSTFVVELQCGDEVFKTDEQVDFIEVGQDTPLFQRPLEEERNFLESLYEEQKKSQSKKFRLLIVEDDECLRKMLVQILEPLFVISEAENGELGLEIICSEFPDLVLSDIMMPNMSGSELCKKIKSNFEICHIPVILLTALSSVEYHIEGYHCGADDYITKPFSVRLLAMRCLSLLNNRRLLQQKFSSGEDSSAQMITTNTMDQKFLDDVVQVIEGNIENGSIDVNLLASKLAISRTKLYLKIKGITGQTPYDFIQNIKLKIAAKLLREHPEMNMSDIAFYLGFSSLNYFGKYFKNYFGVSPSAYRKSRMTE